MAKETKKTTDKTSVEKQTGDSIPKEQVFTAPWEAPKPRPFDLEEFDKVAKKLVEDRQQFEHQLAPLTAYNLPPNDASGKISLSIIRTIGEANQTSYNAKRVVDLFAQRTLSPGNALYTRNRPHDIANEIYQLMSDTKKMRGLCKRLDSGQAETVLLDDITEIFTSHILNENPIHYSNPNTASVEGYADLVKLIRSVGEMVNHYRGTNMFNPSKQTDPSLLSAAGDFSKQPFQIMSRLTAQVSLIRQAINDNNNHVRWSHNRTDGIVPFLAKYSDGKEIPLMEPNASDYTTFQANGCAASVRTLCSNLRNLVARDISAGKLVFCAALDLMSDIHLGTVQILGALIEEHRALVSCIDYLGVEVADLLKHTVVESLRREVEYRVTTVDDDGIPF